MGFTSSARIVIAVGSLGSDVSLTLSVVVILWSSEKVNVAMVDVGLVW